MNKGVFYKDVPIVTDHTAADVRAARAWLKAEREAMVAKRRCSNGVFCAVGGGQVIGEHTRGACHANLSSIPATNATILATITHPPSSCNVETYSVPYRVASVPEIEMNVVRAWYSWLVNESIYHQFIVATTTRQACENGLLITTSTPSNVLAAICVMSRHVREHYGRVVGWYQLVNEGWNKDLAYLVAFGTVTFPKQEGAGPKAPADTYSTDLGHTAIPGVNLDVVTNFMARTFKRLNRPYRESKAYSGINNLYISQGDQTYGSIPFDEKLVAEIKKIAAGETKKDESVSIPNPFGKKTGYGAGSAVVINREIFLKNFREAIHNLCGVEG